MEGRKRWFFIEHIFVISLALHLISNDVEARRRFRQPPPMIKVGNDILSLSRKPNPSQSVDIAPLLSLGSDRHGSSAGKMELYRRTHIPKTSQNAQGVFVLRRKQPTLRLSNINGFGETHSLNQQMRFLNSNPDSFQYTQFPSLGNRRSYDEIYRPPLVNPDKSRLLWMAMLAAQQRSRSIKSHPQNLSTDEGKSEYYRTLLTLLRQHRMQKQAIEHANYLRTLQLLALATSPDPIYSNSPELAQFVQSFQNSPYSSLLNSTFVPTNFVEPTGTVISSVAKNFTFSRNSTQDQIAEASQASERSHVANEYTSLQREIEKERRRLLDVFPPPESEMPFGERTILMVRFPPVPHKKNKEILKIKTAYDIDGGITFGGPRWFSFGTPFNPHDHPWNKEYLPVKNTPPKYVLAEADKPSSYGVIISQNFIYKPSIRFTNSDPKSYAKNKGDILNGGPSIVAQLAKALAEGNRISNSYFLSKAVLQGKTWASSAKKPPFVMVHLDTYTKQTNVSGTLGLDSQEEANYANGTIIYPTLNNPHVLASTKFEFHDGKEIDTIFDKPLATYGEDGYGWGQVPIHPKGIKEIRNFIKLIFKVHQQAHEAGKTKVGELRKLGDQLERPAFPDSKPLLRDQIVDRSTNWLHTGSVGIRSLSDDDDHFPYEKHPLIDVSKDYGHY